MNPFRFDSNRESRYVAQTKKVAGEPAKRTALGNLSNVHSGRQVTGKASHGLVVSQHDKENAGFQKPMVKLLPIQNPPPKVTKVVTPEVKVQAKAKEELRKQVKMSKIVVQIPEEEVEEVSEEEEEALLDMSISMDEMKNLSLEDIDEYDADDPLCCTEIVNEVYEFLRLKELREPLEGNYFEGVQTDITPKMREILIDWLVDVHSRFKLINDTLFMTVSVIDRFLSVHNVHRTKLQLVGVTAMLIASKFEEIYAPEIADFVHITDNSYSRAEIIEYEVFMLNKLGFEISHPTPLHFLRRFSKAALAESKSHSLSKYITELALVDFEILKKNFPPSLIAASAIYLTRKMLTPHLYWNSTLRHYTKYKELDLLPCARSLNEVVKKAQSHKTTLTAVTRKYTLKNYGVATIPCVEL